MKPFSELALDGIVARQLGRAVHDPSLEGGDG